MISDDFMELIVPVAGTVFCVLFIAFIFIKSYTDEKKQKEILTEIFKKYGVKTNAKILRFRENEAYGRFGILGKYNYFIEFQYNSMKAGTVTCSYTLPTNHPDSRKCEETIPIIYIPAYMDYYMELISREEFFDSIGYKLKLGNDIWLVIFAEDLSAFTNLTEL